MCEITKDNVPLVSVIVPMYNGDRFITSCLDSIIAQKYKNFEVIIVDDGSTDESRAICSSYIASSNDDRLSLICKENGGLADARNFGLNHCSKLSEYVVFIDCDDQLTPDCLSLLMQRASHDSLVIGTLLRCHKGSKPKIDNDFGETEYHDIWHNEDFLNRLQYGIINSCCANCYSLKVIRHNNLKFKRLLPEDTFFNFEYLSIVSEVTIVERPVYLYYIWRNSMSTVPKEEIYTNYMILQQRLYEKVSEESYDKINSFVYPQYRVNTMNFLKEGEYAIPRRYLAEELVQRSMRSYSPVTFRDRLLHLCLKYRFLRIAKLV